ncbi:MAG: hypothetical protein M9933_08640 [Chitinophagaceae bacterium]|nr:hypothetical protein [Chitinophagaceae bacterium]
MFTSKDDLKLDYGVDMEIGKFLTDRKVPSENLYWKDRLLYIIPMPGYLFIPLYMDIQYRLGLSKKQLLSEEHLQLLEAILHSAARLEAKTINFKQHIEECTALAEPVNKNPGFLQDLKYYFGGEKEKSGVSLGAAYPSLSRADAYLFSLCCFDFGGDLKKQLADAWYALIGYYLVIDDLEDLESDYEHQEENAVIEAGLDDRGVRSVMDVLDRCYETMNKINPVLANRMDHKRQVIRVKEKIDTFLEKIKNR